MEFLVWIVQSIGLAFYNFFYALTHPGLWLDWSNKESLMRFIYYGGSVELFFVIFTAFLVLTGVGIWRNSVMWGAVRVLEGFANTVGRLFAWAGLLMVIQQIIIIFMQRIFAASQISRGRLFDRLREQISEERYFTEGRRLELFRRSPAL